MSKIHPNHRMRISLGPGFDEVCTLCGRSDQYRDLEKPCPASPEKRADYDLRMETKGHTKSIFSCVGLHEQRKGRQ